jgi:uncharacterized phiE125 gp8 family phage protein
MNDTYKQISKTSATLISTSDMKLFLRVDQSTEDTLIDAMITAAIKTAEKQMNCDLLNATYENCRDSIHQDLTLRRGPYSSLTKIEYMVDGSYVLLASTEYDLAQGGIFGKIDGIDLSESDYDIHPEAIKITFVAGYGTTAADIPADIIMAIKTHVGYLYENRGDCVDINEFENMLLPLTCQLVYKNNRIINLGCHY